MAEFQPINSSNLEAAAYDEAAQELTVKFRNGTSYRYFEVAKDLWREFALFFDGAEGSPGKFFNKHIRPLRCEKVEDDDDQT